MNFTKKQINRAYRDISNIMNDLISSNDISLYGTYVKRIIKEIDQNEVLKFVLEPYFEIEADVVKERNYGFGYELNIPENIDIQIAFVLQIFKRFTYDDKFDLVMFLWNIYNKKRLADNIYPWNYNVVSPVFREIKIRIEDLIEDIPEEKMEVERSYMTIINYGNYNSSNGQVVNGNNNNLSQGLNSSDIFNKLLEVTNKSVEDNEKEEIINLINELKVEKDKPNFKNKVTTFIEKTAKYAPIFMELWGQLNEIIN